MPAGWRASAAKRPSLRQSRRTMNQETAPFRAGAGNAAVNGKGGYAGPPDDDEEAINLGELIAIVLEYKWLIIVVTTLALCVGVLVAFISTPIYKADALLQVEDKNKGLTALQDVQSLRGDSPTVSAELEILGSRMILGRVVDRLHLELVVSPRYAPIIGGAIARRYQGDSPAAPLLGLSKYAWGGERIRLEILAVPPSLQGAALTLVAADADGYVLRTQAQEELLRGRVGELAQKGDLKVFVSELKARPGTEFVVRRVSREQAMDALRAALSVAERGRGSGVIGATLTGPDQEALPRVLDDVINAYVRQNVEYRSAEAESTLRFLETQLPVLKSQLDAAEAAYNNYRQTRGSVDLTIETQSVLGSVVSVDNEIVALQQKREELRQRFTAEHPQVMAVDAQIGRLRGRRAGLDKDVSRLPDTQQTALRLKRDVEVSTALYTSLLNSAQQLRVARAGTVGDARIIDAAAVGSAPVAPRKAGILGASGVIGLLLSLALIWIARAMRLVVEDPDKIEKQLGLPVYATVPHSKVEIEIDRKFKRGKAPGELLALTHPNDDAVESLRSLRTTLHFALLDSARGSILITGPGQGVGKSFISRNLGVVLAQSGKRVVLVDADLRKGHLHKEFGLAREGGVSEFISGPMHISDVLRGTEMPSLKLITTGQLPPNPSELLMHKRFEELLEGLEKLFDVVIVDAPPVLAVSDAAIIGRHTGATLMVARAGRHPIRELEQAVKRLAHAGVQVKGFVFNDLDVNRQRYRYGYEGYVYRYNYKS